MRKKYFLCLFFMVAALMLTSCGGSADVTDTEESAEAVESQEEAESIPVVYEDNDKINLFINNYNIANPDDVIKTDMVLS